jgi:two-component system nitrate/nitrite response regulator NarL
LNELIHEKRIRVLLLDSQALFRTSLGRFLSSQPGIEVAGEYGSSSEALQVLASSQIDLVVLNFERGSQGEAGFMTSARRDGYQGRFLIVAGSVDPIRSAAALKFGASGVFLKSDTPDRLVRAIRLVADGAVWIDQKIMQVLAARSVVRWPYGDERDLLTVREETVLLGILGGLTNRQIGIDIGASEGSVKGVVQQLFQKAGVHTRGQLVRVALEGSLGTIRDLANGSPEEAGRVFYPAASSSGEPKR